ncbi:hypothetical protein AGMMS49928_14070 [Spirochaetia bacterium]|nr:hypothetical protein AGMMS49928_14070 [Spirochaetia bacterium]
MIGAIKRFVQKYILSDEFPLETRLLNIVGIIGLGAALVASISRVLMGFGFIMSMVMAGITLSIVLLLVVSNYFQLYQITRGTFLIVLGNILFPLAFFNLGGVQGSMSAFFVLSIVVIFLFSKGRSRVFFLILHFTVVGASYSVGYFYPRLVTELVGIQHLFDSLLSIYIAGIFIGAVFIFHNRIYEKEKKKVEEAHKSIFRQDKLLRGVNQAAAILLSVDGKENLESALYKGMELLAGAVDADRINIWQNEMIDGKFHYNRIYGWESEYCRKDNLNSLSLAYQDTLPCWEEKISRGESINGPIKNLPQDERERFEPYGLKSILVAPVFLQEKFWGFVSFDDCQSERTFPAEEESILHSGSLLLANAVARNEMTQNLIKAREEALQSSRAKSEFLSNMSHEMRTPMNAIIGMTSIGKSAADMERKNYSLKKIEDASTHLLGVINDILDISKIEANKFELSFEEFNFEKMLQKVVNVINFRIEEQRQIFRVNIDREIPRYILGDDQRLAQVIANLLSNAVKFTPEEGTIRLNANLVSEKDDLCTIKIEVIDTGIGVTPEQKARLFGAFEQADSSTSRKFGGTGLGLAISKRIVEMMGGRIWVESEPEQGSTFAFTINAKKIREEYKSLLSPGVNWSNIKILAVDDDPEIRNFFADLGEQYRNTMPQITWDTAAGGSDAITLIEKNGPYDIYFVDWNMPDMNGVELSRRINESRKQADTNGEAPHKFKQSVVIMISAVDRNLIENEARGAGVNKFLSKPLFPSNITDVVNECLGSAARPEVPATEAEIENFEGFSILLSEDVEINREIVLTILEPTNLAIDCAENGREAVEMFCSAPEKYDMIFMDIQMPEMDGYEATRKIRALDNPRAKKIPIIAMTANVFREDVEQCLAAGMNDHVGKPLDFDEVMKKLREYLHRTF